MEKHWDILFKHNKLQNNDMFQDGNNKIDYDHDDPNTTLVNNGFSVNNEGNVGDHHASKCNPHQLSDYLKCDKDNDKKNIEQGNGINIFLYNKDENNIHQKEEKNITLIKKETI